MVGEGRLLLEGRRRAGLLWTALLEDDWTVLALEYLLVGLGRTVDLLLLQLLLLLLRLGRLLLPLLLLLRLCRSLELLLSMLLTLLALGSDLLVLYQLRHLV